MVQSTSIIIIIPVFYNVKRANIWWNRVDRRKGVYVEALNILNEEKTFNPCTSSMKKNKLTLKLIKRSHDTKSWYIWLPQNWNMGKGFVIGRYDFELETYTGWDLHLQLSSYLPWIIFFFPLMGMLTILGVRYFFAVTIYYYIRGLIFLYSIERFWLMFYWLCVTWKFFALWFVLRVSLRARIFDSLGNFE